LGIYFTYKFIIHILKEKKQNIFLGIFKILA